MSDGIAGQQVDVAVLGAGIVGVSVGIAAQQRGLSVVVIDRREPGSETSYGNAGILSSGSILPLNKPSLWSALPSSFGNIGAALKLHRDWIVKANAGNRIRETGWLKAWRNEATEAARQEQAFLAEFGI